MAQTHRDHMQSRNTQAALRTVCDSRRPVQPLSLPGLPASPAEPTGDSLVPAPNDTRLPRCAAVAVRGGDVDCLACGPAPGDDA